jgi:hypothetical protein
MLFINLLISEPRMVIVCPVGDDRSPKSGTRFPEQNPNTNSEQASVENFKLLNKVTKRTKFAGNVHNRP